WLHEIKYDGYRAIKIAICLHPTVHAPQQTAGDWPGQGDAAHVSGTPALRSAIKRRSASSPVASWFSAIHASEKPGVSRISVSRASTAAASSPCIANAAVM